MKVLMLETFEGIPKVPTGQSLARGAPAPVAVADEAKGIKIYPLPGGAFLVDWGKEQPNLQALAYVGAANVKGALVVLSPEERVRLLGEAPKPAHATDDGPTEAPGIERKPRRARATEAME